MIWAKDVPVYIYGAGMKGRLIYDCLEEAGFHVCGYLDKRAESIVETDQVFHPDAEQLDGEARKNCIVICSITNVFSHKEIADYLQGLGYCHLIYKDFDEANNDIFDLIWNYIEDKDSYDFIEVQKFLSESEISSCAARNGEKETGGGQMAKRKVLGYVDVWVPVLWLFTMPRDRYCQFHRRQDWSRIPYDRNVYYYLYCSSLYEMFDKGAERESWEEALAVYKRYFENADVYAKECLDENFNRHLMQRYEIYQKMNWLFHYRNTFFEENPVIVKWNRKKKYFNVYDGNNRLAFLMAKGMQNVVCRMKEEDFQEWYRKEVITNTGYYEEAGVKEQIDMLYPFFNAEEMNAGGYCQMKIRNIMRWLGEKDFLSAIKTVLFYSCDAVLESLFYKMNIETAVIREAVNDIGLFQFISDLVGLEQYVLENGDYAVSKFYDMLYADLRGKIDDLFLERFLDIPANKCKLILVETEKSSMDKITVLFEQKGWKMERIATYWFEGGDIELCAALNGENDEKI